MATPLASSDCASLSLALSVSLSLYFCLSFSLSMYMYICFYFSLCVLKTTNSCGCLWFQFHTTRFIVFALFPCVTPFSNGGKPATRYPRQLYLLSLRIHARNVVSELLTHTFGLKKKVDLYCPSFLLEFMIFKGKNYHTFVIC